MNAVTAERPPSARSAAALGLLQGAAKGLFMLQQCADCGTVQYPPRDVCHRCLGSELPWREVDNRGTLKAVTTIRASNEPYFQERLPWQIGIVASPLGASLVAHLLPSCRPEEPVTLSLQVDAAGRAVVVASPDTVLTEVKHGLHPMPSDFISDPAGLTVLVTDGESELGRKVTESLLARGARVVFGGSGDTEDAEAVFDTTA